MLGRIETRADVDRRARAGPRVGEVDLAPCRAVEPNLRHAARGAELCDVTEPPATDRPIAGASPVVDVAELHETVPPRVHAEAREDIPRDERAAAIDLVVEVCERAQPRYQAGRAERPAVARQSLLVADLRHESGVGAKVVAGVAIEDARVVVPRGVVPLERARVRSK